MPYWDNASWDAQTSPKNHYVLKVFLRLAVVQWYFSAHVELQIKKNLFMVNSALIILLNDNFFFNVTT